MDETTGYFPVYPGGLKEISDKVAPVALAKGNQLTLAPEDNLRRVQIQSNSQLELYDGRGKAQNGWFVVRSLLPADKTGSVLEWTLTVHRKNWLREPVIGYSQVGYHPAQNKIAVIELDKNDKKFNQHR